MEFAEIFCIEAVIYAHTGSEAFGEKETLQEHTKRCQKYFLKLQNKGNMREALGKMEPVLTGGVPQEYREWFFQALYGVIEFHDTGKVNPVFQREVMGNEAFSDIMIPGFQERNHSALSAYFYLDYFAHKLEVLGKDSTVEKDKLIYLYEILCVNAYLIMRHHSNLDYFKAFLSALQEGGKLDLIDKQLVRGNFKMLYREKRSNYTMPRYAKILNMVQETDERRFVKYIYARLVFSLLTASDYYATNEYMTGMQIEHFGSIREMENLSVAFEKTERMQKIRRFHPETERDDKEDINYLRNMLFYEADKSLAEHKEEDIFFLEAPTGCGKSNVGFHCSFRLASEGMEKLFYVYPFNNLVEQNRASIEELFCGKEILKEVAVVNSVTPIKRETASGYNDESGKEWRDFVQEQGRICGSPKAYYQKALLDRQFLNYPLILTTHVTLFQTMFGTEREAVFGFHQLVGSVLVLDEIQSYKNSLWTEIMMYLQYFCRFLHCKVLIMSATLPDLTFLTGKKEKVQRLIKDRDFYFKDKRFKERVKISYELMREGLDEHRLYEHVKAQAKKKKKIVIEFIKKQTAYRFFARLEADEEIEALLDRMTGDDNSIDRESVLRRIREGKTGEKGYILVATQVIEAGVDIDMDIGYKDISILDSEEQFMGRINRSYQRAGEGIVYFFNLTPVTEVYGKSDYRIAREFTLENEEIREILREKDFSGYYGRVLRVLKNDRNLSSGSEGIREFVENEVGCLDFSKVNRRMQLIEDDNWSMSVFLARSITLENGEVLDGSEIWRQYREILTNPPRDYAVFRVRLSDIVSRLNLFVYQIKKNSDIVYHDRVGEIYYIDNGDDYFENGRFNKEKLETEGGMFL